MSKVILSFTDFTFINSGGNPSSKITIVDEITNSEKKYVVANNGVEFTVKVNKEGDLELK
jgi:hypothetical protein